MMLIKHIANNVINAMDWYLYHLIEGHPLLKITLGMILSATGWVFFVALHHIF
jgi:hypothetical protein